MPSPVTLEHYEVLTLEDGSLHELGRGAMGITYKAYDTRLCVAVALKVINAAHLHRDTARQRFVREARSAARLRHRNVASIYHLGEDSGSYFYVMEFIDGETVEALVKRRGPLPPVFALRIVAQVARALNAAQQHDLVHRDIKPSNMMAVVEDDDLVVKVIDFGLAKALLGDEESSDAGLTQGGILGTPHFASPEQLAGRETDARSDIYSLGVTLWFMLRGTTPFRGSVARVVGAQMSRTPPFEEFDVFPSIVVDLLKRMLTKEPEGRPQSPSELRRQVEECIRLLEGRPKTASLAPSTVHPIPAIPATASGTVESQLESGVTIAGRYVIERELSENESGKSYLARDLQEDRDVRLLMLHRELLANAEVVAQIHEEAASLKALDDPCVLKVHDLVAFESIAFLVLDWTNGFTLRQLLRTRRELPVAEACLLLDQAAAGLDYAASQLPRLELGLHHVLVHFRAPNVIKEEMLRLPVDDWPDFVVKINPLATWREFFATTWTAGQTLVGGLELHERKSIPGWEGAVQAFASIVYELLGGVAAGLHARNYSPIAALDEAGNSILRQALTAPGTGFPTASSLVQALRKTADVTPGDQLPSRRPAQEVPEADALAETVFESGVATTAPVEDEVPPPPPTLWRSLVLLLALGTATVVSVALYRVGSRIHPPAISLSTPAPANPSEVNVAATPAPSTGGPRPAASLLPTPPAIFPTPVPSRQELANLARRAAEGFEARQKSKDALGAWLRMTLDYPEYDAGRLGIELLLERLRRRSGGLTKAEFAAMRSDILRAASLGVLAAMMTLGDELRESNPVQAFSWYCAAAQNGEPVAMTQAGLMLTNGAGTARDMRKAAVYFQMATEKGEATGMTALAECYLEGAGVPEDRKQAITLLHKASAKGSVRATNRLGWCYHKGIGVAVDHEKAFQLFSEAADRDFPEAIGNLGVLYMNGEGVEKSSGKALEKFKEASLKEDRNAMLYYARCLENGVGTKADSAAARTWYGKAAAAGQKEAVEWCRSRGVSAKDRP